MGRLNPKDIPPTYRVMAQNVFLERFRRALNHHKEFSERLSDFDRSLLIRSNQFISGALAIAKVSYLFILMQMKYLVNVI